MILSFGKLASISRVTGAVATIQASTSRSSSNTRSLDSEVSGVPGESPERTTLQLCAFKKAIAPSSKKVAVARTVRFMGAERSVFYGGSVGVLFSNPFMVQGNVNLTNRLSRGTFSYKNFRLGALTRY